MRSCAGNEKVHHLWRVKIMKDTNIVQDVLNAFEYEMNAQRDLRDSSEDNYEYLRGNGWVRHSKAKSQLEKDGKPVLNLNLILPIITLILGYNVQNRYDLKAYAAGMGTSDFQAELITKLLKYTSLESKLQYEMGLAILDALTANIGGYLAIDWTNENNPMGDFLIRRESPFYHLRDSNNEHYDINKGMYHIRTKWLTKEQLLNMYPDRGELINRYTQAAKDNRFQGFMSDMWKKFTRSRQPTTYDYLNVRDGLYRVIELWEMNHKHEDALYNLVSDDITVLKPEQIGKVKELINQSGSSVYEITKIKRKELRVKTVLANADVLVDNQLYDVQNGKFPFVNLFTYWLDGQGMSNIENLKDYQDEHNKRSSQILHILNSMGNSGWWVREMQDGKPSVDVDDLIANNTKLGWVGKYRGDRPPEKIEPNQLPYGHAYLDEQARTGIRATSGIGENIKGGQESSGESGRLFQSRVKQGEIMLSHFFDNMKQSKEILGNYLVDAYPKMYNSERIFQIVIDETNSELFTVNSNAIDNITSGKFKIAIDEVDKSPTAKVQEFVELMSLVSAMPPEMVNWADVLRAAPFQHKEKMAQYAEQVMGMQMQQAQMQGINQQITDGLTNEQKVNG